MRLNSLARIRFALQPNQTQSDPSLSTCQVLGGILVGDFALLIPRAVMGTCVGAMDSSVTAILVILALWKLAMLASGVYLAIRCRIIPMTQ